MPPDRLRVRRVLDLHPHGRARIVLAVPPPGDDRFEVLAAMRGLPLIERKSILHETVPPQPSRLLYVDHMEGSGVKLFEAASAMGLEGIVAKLALAPYGTEPPSWIKIKNGRYSQAIGRREKFEEMRARRDSCS